MDKNENIKLRQANFRQTNAYAMQNGLLLGLWAIMCQAFLVLGIERPLCSALWQLTLVGIPMLTTVLTLRFRKIVGLDVNFPFTRAFTHAFLTLMYAAVWASIATFVYMQFFDQGYIFNAFENLLRNTETIKAMKDLGITQKVIDITNGHTPLEVVEAMRSLGAGNWAAIIIYLYIFTSPFIAIAVGLIARRRVHYKRQA